MAIFKAHVKTFTAIAAVLLLLPSYSQAYWRLECHGIAGIGRVDPLVNPGDISNHVHSIKGASGLTPTSTADDLLKSNCTSCQVVQDKSSYWSSALYFMAKDGTTTIVPEVAGHLSYYKYTPAYIGDKYTYPSAMPKGLTIISGDPYQRNFTLPVPDPPMPWFGEDVTQAALRQKAIGFNCLDYSKSPEPSLYRHFLPEKSYLDQNCKDGLRLELLFPQCWNGELDSPDHKSHLAFPDHMLNGGKCPEGYDKLINQLFYETIYDTAHFKDKEGQFVLSTGDPTGYSYHGDVIFAWEDGVLEEANKQCGPDELSHQGVTALCPVFEIQSPEKQAECKLELPREIQHEKVMLLDSGLPGDNPIQPGPEYATKGHHQMGPKGPKTDAPTLTKPTAIPTLSYTKGSSAANPDDGNVFKVQLSTDTPSSSSTSPAPTPAMASPAPPVAASPLTTPAPAAPVPANPAPGNSLPVVTTEYYTKGNQAYEVIVVAEEVVVTVDAVVTEVPKVRRGHSGRHVKRNRGHVHHLGRS